MAGFGWVIWVGWALVGLGTLGVLVWLARRTAKGSRLCPTCDYDLSATTGLACPECGNTAKSERALGRRRRKRVWGRLGLVVLLLGIGALVFNPGRRDGWASSVPDWAIWPLMPLADDYADDWIKAYETARGAIPVAQMTEDTMRARRWERLLISRRLVREVRRTALEGPSAQAPTTVQPALRQPASWTQPRGARMDHGVRSARIASDLLDIAEEVSDAARRREVIGVLSAFGPLDASDIERLRRMLDSANPEMWDVTFPILRSSVADGRPLTPEILLGLERLSSTGRAEFLRDLYDLVPLEDVVIQKVAALQSSDPDQMVRARAAAVVWRNEALTKPRK